jgi:hypothetical protein
MHTLQLLKLLIGVKRLKLKMINVTFVVNGPSLICYPTNFSIQTILKIQCILHHTSKNYETIKK